MNKLPWTIVKGGGACTADRFAVIKKADDSTAGCHETETDAKKQLAALYVSEKKKRSVPMRRNTLVLAGESERRGLSAEAAELEIRSVNSDIPDSGPEERFSGYAAVYNTRAAIGNPATVGFYEQIAPGAFNKTLQEGDARFLIDHNAYYVVSRVSAGTLDLRSDERGLSVDSALDTNLSYVKDLAANVRNRNITGMSFGFSVVKDEWMKEQVRSADGKEIDAEVRTLLEVRLPEVSGVTFPAYTKTQAELKSVANAMRSRVELHGDIEAVERRAEHWPELLEICGIDPELRRTIIDLGSTRAVVPEPRAAADDNPTTVTVNATPPCSCSETRGVTPPHSTATSDAPWDAAANESNVPADASVALLRQVYAWVDPANPTKTAAKFPHHFVSSDGKVGAASTAASRSIIASLNGARSAADIPTSAKHGVYQHASMHMADAGLEVTELKSSEPPESTRDDQNTTDDDTAVEPAASTQLLGPSIDDRMRALALRFHLPV